jgi:hypothetical protein
MTFDQDRPFRPQLEALEARSLPSLFPALFLPAAFPRILPASPHVVTAATTGTHTPAMIHTIVNPLSPLTRAVSLVPQHISLYLGDQPSPITVQGGEAGISEPGLPSTATLGLSGLTTAGLPQYAPSQPVTAPQLLTHMITLNPDGSVGGSLW